MTAAPDPRFVRQTILPGFGAAGQASLESAAVLVLGAGGLGSAVLPTLAAAGIGTIGIVDDDTVERSNLHRQTLHTAEDLGRYKTHSATDRLRPITPGTVVAHTERFTAANAERLAADYDVIVDGTDNFETRYLANDVAVRLGIPLVWGALSQFSGHAGVVPPGGPDYRDLFPDPPDSVLSCEAGGVLPSVCAVIGGILATETLKVLTGIGKPLTGRVTTYDARTGVFREVPFQRDPARERPAAAPAPALPDADALDAPTLAGILAGGATVQLVDVREPWEAEVAALPGATLLPLRSLAELAEDLDRSVPVIAYCHHGARSERALHTLRAAGFDVRHLEGGIDAWSRTVDPTLPRY